MADEFCLKMPDFHVNIQGSFTCRYIQLFLLFFLIHFDTFSVLAIFCVHCVKITMNVIQGVAVECDDMQILLLMCRIEYKEINVRDIDNKIPFNTCLLFIFKKSRLPARHAVAPEGRVFDSR
jgi:hypothetical protein